MGSNAQFYHLEDSGALDVSRDLQQGSLSTVKKSGYQAIVYLITVNFPLLFPSVGCQVVCDLIVNFTTFGAFLKAVAPGLIQLCKKLRFIFF